MKSYFLGIDTSCYTTSCALVDASGELVHEERILLKVKDGQRGLQQSQMVFQHTKNLPLLMKMLSTDGKIEAIGVSAFPRREEDSYMPAFMVGYGLAQSLSHVLQVPLYEFSHQENHIFAALREHRMNGCVPLLGLHVSGGTTELIKWNRRASSFPESSILGGEDDIAAGQLIDRIGVALGLPFPAGPALEKLANEAPHKELRIPSSVRGLSMSFGGPYSAALRLVEQKADHREIAYAVLKCVCNSLHKLLAHAFQEVKAHTLIAVGGVMSNAMIRKEVEKVCSLHGKELYFASPRFSSDNASGNAYGAYILHHERKD